MLLLVKLLSKKAFVHHSFQLSDHLPHTSHCHIYRTLVANDKAAGIVDNVTVQRCLMTWEFLGRPPDATL